MAQGKKEGKLKTIYKPSWGGRKAVPYRGGGGVGGGGGGGGGGGVGGGGGGGGGG